MLAKQKKKKEEERGRYKAVTKGDNSCETQCLASINFNTLLILQPSCAVSAGFAMYQLGSVQICTIISCQLAPPRATAVS